MKVLPTQFSLAFEDWSVNFIEKTMRTKFAVVRLDGWEMVSTQVGLLMAMRLFPENQVNVRSLTKKQR